MTRLTVDCLSMFLRRFPFEAGRWRLIPYGLNACRKSYTTPRLKCIRTRYGHRLRVDVSEWIGRHIYVTGQFEDSTSNLFYQCLRPGDTFIDVGANIGFFTILAGHRVGPTGRVLAFEPVPSVREELGKNISLNGLNNCQVLPIALSNTDGECELSLGPSNHVGTSSFRQLGEARGRLLVSQRRFDSLSVGLSKVDWVKIDIEGAECHALEGMASILKRDRPNLVVEITPEYLRQLDRSIDDLFELLHPLAYRMYVIEHHGLRQLKSWTDYSAPQFNALFSARERPPTNVPILY